MFKLQDEIIYPWPVTVEMPSATKAGVFEKYQFTVHFAGWSKEDQKKLDDEALEDRKRPAGERQLDQDELLLRVVQGWEDVTDAGDRPLAFNAANLKALLSRSWIRIGLYNAWNESMTPGVLRAGN